MNGLLSLFLVGVVLIPHHVVWAESESTLVYSKVGDNLKCQYESNTRLFRTPDNAPLSMDQCFKQCLDTSGCEFFTLGIDPVDPDYVGVCMGCTESSMLEEHPGFSTYQVPPCPNYGPVGGGTGTKCPDQSEYRLFLTDNNNPVTMEQCYLKCSETEGCNYFSLGVDPEEPDYKGVCMGCIKGSFFDDHPGFETYEMWEHCAPKPILKVAIVFDYSKPFDVSGTVYGPVVEAVITLKDEHGAVVGTTNTITAPPNEGTFEFVNLDPGIYTVEEQDLDTMQGSLSGGVSNTNDRIEVVLTPSADQAGRRLVVKNSNQLRGAS